MNSHNDNAIDFYVYDTLNLHHIAGCGTTTSHTLNKGSIPVLE
jgi:hypothetical protein